MNFRSLLQDAVDHVNSEYEVGELQMSFPNRVAELIEAKGERLKR